MLLINSKLPTIAAMTGVKCIATLKALGELNRMRILRLLLKSQLSVNEIVRQVNVSQYTVSKNLKILREAGLVEVERHGKQRLYAVARRLTSHLKTNANVLELGCCSFRFDRLPR
jgi:DNA-binding transcriptional ArsR family regulator